MTETTVQLKDTIDELEKDVDVYLAGIDMSNQQVLKQNEAMISKMLKLTENFEALRDSIKNLERKKSDLSLRIEEGIKAMQTHTFENWAAVIGLAVASLWHSLSLSVCI